MWLNSNLLNFHYLLLRNLLYTYLNITKERSRIDDSAVFKSRHGYNETA